MPSSAQLFRAIPLNGKSITLLLSASLHAAVALAAVRGAPHASLNASLPEDPRAQIAELDLTPIEASEAALPVSKMATVAPHAHHHHDYPVPPDHDASQHDPALRHTLPVKSNAKILPAAPAPAAAMVAAPAPAPPHFVITVGASTRAVIGSGVENGTNAEVATSEPAQPVAEASVDVPAQLIAGDSPSYTHEAEAAGIEAVVPMEIVVDAAGAVIGARALSRVGYGLDEAALRSVRGYRFSPAQRGGKAMPVRKRWMMRFQLR